MIARHIIQQSHAAAGMATSITFSCRCDLLDKRRKRHTESLVPEMRAGVDGVDGVDGIPTKPDSPCSYSIN
jgi:hypothetical protein